METTILNSKIVKDKSLTMVGLKSNQDSQQIMFDEILLSKNIEYGETL